MAPDSGVNAAEVARLGALREYGVLDTREEPAYDDIARLAASVCGTPTAVISFIDETRQWFKARVGMAAHYYAREISFCAYAIRNPGPIFEVRDASVDARFAHNPLVAGEPVIRFYAGCPLVTPGGHAIGTLAVIDFVPRSLSAEQRAGLEALARQVMAQLELRRRWFREEGASADAEAIRVVTAARHDALIASALDAIITMDAQGRVTDFNPAAEQLFGYARTEAIGQPLGELIIPPPFRDAHNAGLARYLQTREGGILGRRVEMVAMRRDGSQFPVELAVHTAGLTPAPEFVGFIRDITDRVKATQQLQASEERNRQQRKAITGLVQDERLYREALPVALQQITEVVAATLNAGRVGVWEYSDGPPLIRCLDLYDTASGQHAEGAELLAREAPAYFKAVTQAEVVAAADARHDPRTRELSERYLTPLGVGSRLDARIHVDGMLAGVLCVEHLGTPRQWTAEDETFTVAVANLI